MAAWERGAAGHQRGGMEGSRPPGFAVRHLADHLRSRSWAHTRDLGEHNHAVPPEGAGGGRGRAPVCSPFLVSDGKVSCTSQCAFRNLSKLHGETDNSGSTSKSV